MNPNIELRIEAERGCGFRKPGGLYLIADGPSAACGKLPIPLDVCPCCGNGIKPTRGWTWVNGTALAASKVCDLAPSLHNPESSCAGCPLAQPMGRVGLLWIGEKFYATPGDFLKEAGVQGISRRISAVPRDFKVSETWVWLAHRKCIPGPDGTFTPGVFRIFKPQRIEYVVKGTETDEEIKRLVERGITPVKVERAATHDLEFAGAASGEPSAGAGKGQQ